MRKNGVFDVLNRIPRLVEGKKFLLALGLVLLLGLILRIAYFDADPPLGITRSQDFSTDPFSYNMFAENKVDYGNANPLNDQRWILYERSTQTLAALSVYTVAGTGRAAGNFVAVLLNLLAITFIALGIRNFGSRIGAIAFALIAAVSYIVVFFGRTPFLEASQNFWLAAAFLLLLAWQQENPVLCAGRSRRRCSRIFWQDARLGYRRSIYRGIPGSLLRQRRGAQEHHPRGADFLRWLPCCSTFLAVLQLSAIHRASQILSPGARTWDSTARHGASKMCSSSSGI